MKERISLDPTICNGRPVVSGTRISVQTIMGFLGAGESIEAVLEEYPVLTREDIQACFEYSARILAQPLILDPVA